MIEWKVSDELERMWQETACPNLRYHLRLCLKILRKPANNLSQDSWSEGRDLNPGRPVHEAEVLTTQPWRSVRIYKGMPQDLILSIFIQSVLSHSVPLRYISVMYSNLRQSLPRMICFLFISRQQCFVQFLPCVLHDPHMMSPPLHRSAVLYFTLS